MFETFLTLAVWLIVWGFLMERVTELVLKPLGDVWKDAKQKDFWHTMIGMIVPVILTPLARIDLFELLNFEFAVPYLGMILSGLLFSGGSKIIHDLIETINANKNVSRALAGNIDE